ncbi:putative F-box protein At1g76830 [Papaver somniferum]|uniref:putative F-box protein At1g76830 n=1 Tax=Papaver somniferum TaxID=3469 RepID=UPI000E70457D|nr:putative F-box protein At1g76830 [Papaver somniferum]
MILASPFKDNNSLVGSPNGFKYDNTLLGSFNGLICIRDEPDVSLCICNPMTKEYVILPEPGKNPGRNWSSGFGYLASTNEYKVVTLYREDKDPWTLNVMVYTLGSGNGWRNVAKLDIKTNLVVSTRQGVFLNGALYWVKVRLGVIVVFDLVNEKFLKQLPPPAFPQPPDYCNWTAHAVGVLGGLLVYSATCSKPRYHSQNAGNRFYDIWLSRKGINNYDIKDQEKKYQPLGWTKEFRLNDDNVLEFTKSGGVLSYSSHYLNIYNPNTSTSKMLVDFSTEQFCQVFPHKNTLLSLKEMGEKDTKIMESGYISWRQLKAAIGR